MIYAFESKGVIEPNHSSRGTLQGRVYSERDVRRLSILNRSYAFGLTPERARELALEPSRLRNGRTAAAIGTIANLVSTLGGDSAFTWDKLCAVCADLVESRRCFIFIFDRRDRSPVLELKTSFCRLEPDNLAGRKIPDDWFGQFKERNRLINLFGEDLANDPYVRTLDSPLTCTSVLAVPIRGRKAGPKGLVGIIVFENRLSPDGIDTAGSYFDPESEEISEILASVVAQLTFTLPRLDAPGALVRSTVESPSLSAFLREVLKFAVPLVGAYRGDVVWRNEATDKTEIVQQFGDSEVKLGDDLPHRSVTHRVLDTGNYRIIGDVDKDEDYFPTNRETHSELAIPLKLPGRARPSGAINVESRELQWFDDHDRVCLEALGEYASIYARIVETNQVFTRLLPENLDEVVKVYNPGLKRILQEIEYNLGLDRAVTFLADRVAGVLRCAALNGFDETKPEYQAFSFPFEETAITTKVFHDKRGYFSQNPRKDLFASRRATEFFMPASPVIGTPLLFGETAIGVMVLWSSEDGKTTKQHVRALEPFAQLAVTSVAVARTEQQRLDDIRRHATTLGAIRKLMSELRSEVFFHGVIRSTLEAVIQTDFDRARVFDYDVTRRVFKCIDSLGVEAPGTFKNREIQIVTSPYALRTEKAPPEYSEAELRDPQDPRFYGSDPSSSMFGKPPDLPWAVQPLFSGRRLLGYIAADQKHSRRPITPWELGSLSVFGTLAGQALANLSAHTATRDRSFPRRRTKE